MKSETEILQLASTGEHELSTFGKHFHVLLGGHLTLPDHVDEDDSNDHQCES